MVKKGAYKLDAFVPSLPPHVSVLTVLAQGAGAPVQDPKVVSQGSGLVIPPDFSKSAPDELVALVLAVLRVEISRVEWVVLTLNIQCSLQAASSDEQTRSPVGRNRRAELW